MTRSCVCHATSATKLRMPHSDTKASHQAQVRIQNTSPTGTSYTVKTNTCSTVKSSFSRALASEVTAPPQTPLRKSSCCTLPKLTLPTEYTQKCRTVSLQSLNAQLRSGFVSLFAHVWCAASGSGIPCPSSQPDSRNFWT